MFCYLWTFRYFFLLLLLCQILEDNRKILRFEPNTEYTRIEANLEVSVHNIIKTDFFSLIDPRIALMVKEKGSNDFKFTSQTETVLDSHDVTFEKHLDVEASPEAELKVK